MLLLMCCVGWVIKNQKTNLHAAKESSKRHDIKKDIKEQQLGNQKTKKTYMQQKNPAKDIKEQHLGFQQLGSQKTKKTYMQQKNPAKDML
jgi:hypothetical protein